MFVAVRFARAELPSLAGDCEARNAPVPTKWRKEFASQGFLGINIAEKYGGHGLGNLEAIIVIEEL